MPCPVQMAPEAGSGTTQQGLTSVDAVQTACQRNQRNLCVACLLLWHWQCGSKRHFFACCLLLLGSCGVAHCHRTTHVTKTNDKGTHSAWLISGSTTCGRFMPACSSYWLCIMRSSLRALEGFTTHQALLLLLGELCIFFRKRLLQVL